jgi:hypothetical protein
VLASGTLVQHEQTKGERKRTHVRMRRARDIFGARTVFERKHSLRDHLTSIRTYKNGSSYPRVPPNTNTARTDDMYSENYVRLGLHKELDLSLGIQVGLGARVGEEREAADFILHAFLLEFLLRLADPRDFRVRVYDARDRAVVHVSVSAVDVLCSGDALLFCLVREHGSEGHVADAFDVRHAGVELVVDHDASAWVDFDADFIEAEALDVWPAADGDEDNVRLELRLYAM